MKITATSVYSGPSIYAQRPVVHYRLEVPQHPSQRSADRNTLEELFRELPDLRTHSALCGAPNCFQNRRAGEHFPISHLFEHICIVLQNRAGAELACVRPHPSGHVDSDSAVVPFEEPEVCTEAARLASDLLKNLTAAETGLTDGVPRKFDFPARFERFSRFAAGTMLSIQDRVLVKAAGRLGIPAVRIVGRTVALGQGRFQRRVSGTKTSLTDVLSNDLAANKDYSRRVLSQFGLPVPRYERVYRARTAIEAASRIGYPVVVKPNDGSMGRGVGVLLNNRKEVSDAYKRARAVSRSVLVEEFVEGDDHRIVVINGKFCAATRRVPAHVVGDGVKSIEELVAEVNSDPRRAPGHSSSWTRIEMDEQSDALISELGYTRLAIPPKGQVVYLRRIANSSAGGTSIDVTDEVHPDNREIAVRAARVIGLDIAGVDILTTDISSSLWRNGGKIGEINSKPGLRKHLWPAAGKPRDVMTPILEMLFPAGSPSRVPIVAIVGTGATRIVAQMLAHVLAAAGHHVGLLTERRVYSGGHQTGGDDVAQPAAVRRILLDPEVDVAVLEFAPDDVLRYGLGCDRLDVVAIVNDGRRGPGPDRLEALRTVARTAGTVVFVGGSPDLAAELESACTAARLCTVVLPGRTDRQGAKRARLGGCRVVLKGDSITVHDGGRQRLQLPVSELLTNLPGLDRDELVQSAVYASVSALSLGKKSGDICQSLSSFRLAPGPLSGRREGRRPKGRSSGQG